LTLSNYEDSSDKGHVGTGRTGMGPLLGWPVVLSFILHLVGVPALLLVAGFVLPGGPSPRQSIEIVMDRSQKQESAETEPIREPPPPVETRTPPLREFPDEPPMELLRKFAPARMEWESPSISPIDVRFPLSSSGKGKRVESVRGGKSASALKTGHPGEGGAKATGPADPPMEAQIPTPPILFPPEPPESMISVLPPGGMQLGPGKSQYTERQKEDLLRRVYSKKSYPPEALDLALEGTVVVRFRLDDAGIPSEIRTAESCQAHELLQEMAVEMIRRGAPYPVPALRRTMDLYVAVAVLNTDEEQNASRIVVRPSGNATIDAHAVEMAAQDAGPKGSGWYIL